jgi:hypothetical protein
LDESKLPLIRANALTNPEITKVITGYIVMRGNKTIGGPFNSLADGPGVARFAKGKAGPGGC